jgi:hypothetical protein
MGNKQIKLAKLGKRQQYAMAFAMRNGGWLTGGRVDGDAPYPVIESLCGRGLLVRTGRCVYRLTVVGCSVAADADAAEREAGR